MPGCARLQLMVQINRVQPGVGAQLVDVGRFLIAFGSVEDSYFDEGKLACAVLYRTHFYFSWNVMIKSSRPILFLLLVSFSLAACASPAPTATPTFAPTVPPTSSVPLVILLSSPESDPVLLSAASEIATAYASEHGMQYEQRTILNPAELPPSLAKLIVLAPDPGISALALAAPQAQVIAIGFSTDASITNLSSLPVTTNNEAQTAFVAGYISAITAEDWRAGMLYTASSAPVVNDFVAGAEYFCGSCAPVAQPLIDYPATAQTDTENWQAAADLLLSQSIEVVYLSPELEGSGAAQYLANFGVLLIGSGVPPADSADSWIVSITSDVSGALHQLLPRALDGQPLQEATSLSLMNVNPNLLSESRQSFVRPVIDDLQAGYIQLPTD
jgi:hypothetical protein